MNYRLLLLLRQCIDDTRHIADKDLRLELIYNRFSLCMNSCKDCTINLADLVDLIDFFHHERLQVAERLL